MNCFELVKSVLDEIYAEIVGEESEKDQQITKKLQQLRLQYSKLATHTGDGDPVDYSDPVTRFAYIYAYVTAHADLVSQQIGSSQDIRHLFKQKHIDVTCIGGGPGSDFIGILKHLMSRGNETSLHCVFYDREEAWGESWQDVSKKIGRDAHVSTYSQRFDVTEEATWTNNRKYLRADLFTTIYFFSEVYSKREQAEKFFANLFQNMKSKAMMLYIDNDSPVFNKWFDDLITMHGLEVMGTGEEDARLEYGEQKVALGEYLTKFDSSPKLTARIAYRVCRKP